MMHPDIAAALAREHRTELLRQAERRRRARDGSHPARPAAIARHSPTWKFARYLPGNRQAPKACGQ